MAIPGFLFILIYYYIPMIGIIIAFQDFKYDKGPFGSKFIGFDNFRFFFTSQYASRIITNTVFLNAVFIITTLITSVFIAIFLNRMKNVLYAKFVQSSLFFPYFISWVVVGYFALAFFSETYGVANKLLQWIGLNPVSWYSRPRIWPFILTAFNLWKQVGVNAVIYLAAIINISEEYYDAAKIDGAGPIKQVRYITIPEIIPIISIMVLLSIGQIFRSDFGLFYNVTRDIGLLYSTTDVIDTFVIRSLRVIGDMGMASAAGFFQSVIGFVMVLVSNYVVKRINSENSLF